VGPIDFGPVSGIDWGCKFPYGFITCYAKGVTEWFDVTPRAPEFDLAIPDVTLGGTTYHVVPHWDVDLSVMDPYMAILRTLLTVVVWVGAVYFVASRFLGFHAAGNPGDAADDAMEHFL
jgi:hypothetical protein